MKRLVIRYIHIPVLYSVPSRQICKDKGRLHVIEGIVPALQNLDREGCRFAAKNSLDSARGSRKKSSFT